MKSKPTLLVATAGLLVLGAATWRCAPGLLTHNDGEAAQATPKLRPIPTAVVQPLADRPVRQFPGTVRATRRVQLAFSVPGVLTELHAQEGAGFHKGDILAWLDQRDYEHARQAAAAKYADAKQHFGRLAALRAQDCAAEAEYDNAEAARDIAEAELRICEKALEDTVLLAPFDGVVARRYVENHEHVAAKQPILSFQDISVIEVVVQMPERLIAHGGVASLGVIQVSFDADADRWFDAAVREFSVQSDPITRTYDVVVGLTPPTNLDILPGMTATVRAQVTDVTGANLGDAPRALIPAEAVVCDPDGASYVWIVEPSGGAPRRQPVRTGVLRVDGIEVLSGLQPGLHVAVAGLHTLREDMRVRPVIEGGEGLDG